MLTFPEITKVRMEAASDTAAPRFPRLREAKAWCDLFRLEQAAMVAVGTVLGGRLAVPQATLATSLWLALSNALLFAASMSLNDCRDQNEDSINKPRRPLPSGRITGHAALRAAALLFAAALCTAVLAKPRAGWLAPALVAASAAYSVWLKRVPIAGHLLVAVVSAYPLWCWMLIQEGGGRLLAVIAVGCMVFRFGAEISKSAEDVAGDGASGIATLATLRGPSFANRVGATCMVAAVLCCWLVIRDANGLYLGLLTLATLLAGGGWAMAFFTRMASRGALFVSLERTIMTLMAAAVGLGLL